MEINELFSTVAKLHPSQENLLASILGCYITMVTRFKPFFRTRGYTFIFKTIFEIFVSAKQNMCERLFFFSESIDGLHTGTTELRKRSSTRADASTSFTGRALLSSSCTPMLLSSPRKFPKSW